MRKLLIVMSLSMAAFVAAQNVLLTSVAKVSENSEKYLYRISPENPAAEYLGELEVQGFSPDDVETFGMIYKKAKEIGANTFAVSPFYNVDDSERPFDPGYYRFRLYFLPAREIPADHNAIYIINGSAKSQKITYNGQNISLPPRTFIKDHLKEGKEYSLSAGKLLGSKIRMAAKDTQPVQYFQISGTRVSTNPNGTPGLNLKSGDIIVLERSYGDYLRSIYAEISVGF